MAKSKSRRQQQPKPVQVPAARCLQPGFNYESSAQHTLESFAERQRKRAAEAAKARGNQPSTVVQLKRDAA